MLWLKQYFLDHLMDRQTTFKRHDFWFLSNFCNVDHNQQCGSSIWTYEVSLILDWKDWDLNPPGRRIDQLCINYTHNFCYIWEYQHCWPVFFSYSLNTYIRIPVHKVKQFICVYLQAVKLLSFFKGPDCSSSDVVLVVIWSVCLIEVMLFKGKWEWNCGGTRDW